MLNVVKDISTFTFIVVISRHISIIKDDSLELNQKLVFLN